MYFGLPKDAAELLGSFLNENSKFDLKTVIFGIDEKKKNLYGFHTREQYCLL